MNMIAIETRNSTSPHSVIHALWERTLFPTIRQAPSSCTVHQMHSTVILGKEEADTSL